MSYQTFDPNIPGHSNSFEKLNRAQLPLCLKNKKILDIGCNEGFFCFEAKKRGATSVIGIDTHGEFIERAKKRSETLSLDVKFINTDCYHYFEEKFDIILVLSVLHYISNPALFFERLSSLLAPGGFIILEAGVIDGEINECKRVYRDDTDYLYPTQSQLYNNWLKNFTVNFVGDSIFQEGDPVPRKVYHCYNYETLVIPKYISKINWSNYSKKGFQILNLDDILLTKKPRSLSRVPAEQIKIFNAYDKNPTNIYEVYKEVLSDDQVTLFIMQIITKCILCSRGCGVTILDGIIVNLLSSEITHAVREHKNIRVINI